MHIRHISIDIFNNGLSPCLSRFMTRYLYWLQVQVYGMHKEGSGPFQHPPTIFEIPYVTPKMSSCRKYTSFHSKWDVKHPADTSRAAGSGLNTYLPWIHVYGICIFDLYYHWSAWLWSVQREHITSIGYKATECWNLYLDSAGIFSIVVVRLVDASTHCGHTPCVRADFIPVHEDA